MVTMRNNLTQLRIIYAFLKNKEPLILNHIAKLCDLSPQLVEYHIKKLIEEGIIIKVSVDDDTSIYYQLQPFFYDKDMINALYILLGEFSEYMFKGITLKDTNKKPEHCFLNCLHYALRIFEEETKNLFKNDSK